MLPQLPGADGLAIIIDLIMHWKVVLWMPIAVLPTKLGWKSTSEERQRSLANISCVDAAGAVGAHTECGMHRCCHGLPDAAGLAIIIATYNAAEGANKAELEQHL